MTPKPFSPSDLVRVQARALLSLAMRLDGDMQGPFVESIDRLAACVDAHCRVIVTGIGKSGLIARKIAATLCSTGTPAQFLHPVEAVHGDLGMICAGDVVLALSASGETEEILRLLAVLARRSVSIISLTGAVESTLARASVLVLDSSVTEEACSFDLAPTASTTVMLALGDALAIAVSRRRNFQAEDFADLHPGGRLGRRLTAVRDLMHSGEALPRVTMQTPMPDVIYEMSRKKLGMTTVLSAIDGPGRLLGIVSDGDLRRLLECEGPRALERNAGEIMNPAPITIEANVLAPAALVLMEQKKITSLIVTGPGGGEVLGVVHLHDLWSLELP